MAARRPLEEEELVHRNPVDAAGYAMIYHVITRDPALSDGAFRTYILLLSFSWQTNACWPGQETLGQIRSCDARTIRRHLDELQRLGLLTIERRGDKQTNRYILENVHRAYEQRQDKNVRSGDRTKMSGRDGTKTSAPPTGQKRPPKNKQSENYAEGRTNSNNARNPQPDASAAADPVLVEELVVSDLNRVDAIRLAGEKPEECRRQLSFLPFVTEFKTSRGAYLRRAIEQGFAPPKGWTDAQRTEELNRRRTELTAVEETRRAQDRAIAEAREQVIEAEKARIQAEQPEEWARIVAEAEASLAPPLRGKTSHRAYGPALQGAINRILVVSGLLNNSNEGNDSLLGEMNDGLGHDNGSLS